MKKTVVASLPSFGAPPVVEVVVGVQFEQKIAIKTLDVASLWESFGKKDYPDYMELKPLDPTLPPNLMRFEFTQGPDFPRYLFKKRDGSDLIQFQRDRFVYNWTRPDGAGPECYPRYTPVMEQFLRHYDSMMSVINEKGLPPPKPAILDLTYVNLIDQNLAADGEISKIFKDIRWESSKVFLPLPKRTTFNYEFEIEPLKAVLHAHALPVQLVKDGRNMLKFELSVKGPLQTPDVQGMQEWYGQAREWIVRGFSDLTTPAMHKEWRRSDE